MNVRPELRMSKAAFVEWDAGEGQRCELVGGACCHDAAAVAGSWQDRYESGGSPRTGLDRRQWEVIAEFGLDTGPETLRYPDIVVYPAGSPDKSRTTSTPTLLAEVLSPSNAEIDFGDKMAEYLELPSLLTYVVLSQDEPKAWKWSRPSTSAPFAPVPKMISGAEAVIPVAGLQLELPMADIYAGLQAD